MESARIGLFEDNLHIREITTEILKWLGHTVTFVAEDFEKSLAVVELLEPDTIDVAIIDGNLGRSMEDGAEIVEKIIRKYPAVYTVGHSSSGHVNGAALQAKKCDKESLSAAIRAVPQPQSS